MKDCCFDINIKESFDKLMEGYTPSQDSRPNWEMQNGIYQQYSAYENREMCPSGTSSSIQMI